MSSTLSDRYRGCLLGLACGDAVGTTVEFQPRNTFTPVTDMVGGGPFSLKPGQWTDDTSMALCLAESLLQKRGFDAADQMGRYLNWWHWGYLSSTGDCFDIGMTVRGALERYQSHGDPFAGDTAADTAGNGSLMRLAPVVLFFYPDRERIRDFAALSSRTTHGATEAVECCQVLADVIANALTGASKADVLRVASEQLTEAKVIALAQGAYQEKVVVMCQALVIRWLPWKQRCGAFIRRTVSPMRCWPRRTWATMLTPPLPLSVRWRGHFMACRLFPPIGCRNCGCDRRLKPWRMRFTCRSEPLFK